MSRLRNSEQRSGNDNSYVSAHPVAPQTSLLIPRSLYTITRLLHTRLPREVCDMRYPHLHAVCYVFNISGRNLAQYEERVSKIRISDDNAWQRHEKRWISGESVLPHYADLKRLYEPFSQGLIPRIKDRHRKIWTSFAGAGRILRTEMCLILEGLCGIRCCLSCISLVMDLGTAMALTPLTTQSALYR
jgi:hypothetical protein